MTAHCLPSPHPDSYAYDDFDLAADIVMSITARKGQNTAVAREIAAELRRFFAGRELEER
jgi:hypothetical protein